MKPFLTIMLVLLLSGCASDVAGRYYSNEKYPARPADEVEVFTSAPTRPYEVIADLQARGASVNYMKRQAAKIGADGIIVSMLGGYRSGSDIWAGIDSYSNTYSRITATAIKFKN